MYLELLTHYSLWGNTAYDYLLAVGIFLSSLLVMKVFEKIIASRFKKASSSTDNKLDDILASVVNNIGSLFYLTTAFFVAFQWVQAGNTISNVVNIVFAVVAAREGINAISRLMKFGAEKYLDKVEQEETELDAEHATTIVSLLRKSVVVVLWLVLATFILSNFGVNITSLITGLGVGGIAIGFALQNILGDIFSSVSIFLDKPFKVGDFIQVGEDVGTVKKIGIKSTRIETLRGEQLIISNKELTSVRVQNYSKTEKIRDQITVGVSYGTDQETLRQIPSMVRKIIEDMEDMTFDRCRLISFGDSSINFKVVYFVNSNSFADLDKKKEELNYAIYDKFKQEGIEFPFPTRTVHLKKES
ncbi:MAG: mechanosensitive ion channel family protein [Candidatus Paceibacteria bacterium]